MSVVDEVTGNIVSKYEVNEVVVNHIHNFIIYGYASGEVYPILVYIRGRLQKVRASLPLMKDKLVFSKNTGYYISTVDLPEDLLLSHTQIFGVGNFPYEFQKNYEAIDTMYAFRNKQYVLNDSDNKISKYLKYTFGLEFETSQGYIPQDLCYRDGLIPLRDGSISGLEYSTVILEGNEGINLLKQQVDTLKEYTYFNKECSLHMHFGGFPLTPEYLFRVYTLCKNLEYSIINLVPELTFRSSEYKANGKNYCKPLPKFSSFEDMYIKLVGRRFFGNLTQPHPKDLDRTRKWNINTRYYAVNFINAMCYDVNKTIEFRFLRPTFNYKKILLWIYIFNAILLYAEKYEDVRQFCNSDISFILNSIYPPDLSAELLKGIQCLQILKNNQTNAGDYCGREILFEDKLFNKNLNY